MQILSKLFIFLLISIAVTNVDELQAKKMKAQSVSEQILSSHVKINRWKKKLTKQQQRSLKPLFDMYDDLYKQYQLNQGSAAKQSLVLDGAKAIEHVMDHWDTFYKQYAAQTVD